MNPIANSKTQEVLDYLCIDLENPVDTSASRAEQQKGLEVFRQTMIMLTVEDMQDCEYFKFYQNSRTRSRFDERFRVSLTSKNRTDGS